MANFPALRACQRVNSTLLFSEPHRLAQIIIALVAGQCPGVAARKPEITTQACSPSKEAPRKDEKPMRRSMLGICKGKKREKGSQEDQRNQGMQGDPPAHRDTTHPELSTVNQPSHRAAVHEHKRNLGIEGKGGSNSFQVLRVAGSKRLTPALSLSLLFTLLSFVACASSDLGSPCVLLKVDNSDVSPRPGHALLHSGNGECEHFACVSYEGGPPRCSRPCSKGGESCEGGLVCRAVVLNPEFIESARERMEGKDEDGDGRDDFEQHLASLSESLYCVMNH